MRTVPLALSIFTGITTVAGVAASAIGDVHTNRARAQIRRDETRYQTRHANHLAEVDRANVALQSLGRTQERATRDVILRMHDFLKRQAKQVRVRDYALLDGMDGSSSQGVLDITKLGPGMKGWAWSAIGSAAAGAATPAVIHAAVTNFARASTGTPISALRGAAAERAVHAFLGGGTLANGGGGAALGKNMLKAAPVGPRLLAAGLITKHRGAKARTRAEEFHTEVDAMIAQMDTLDQFYLGVRKRADELGAILIRLSSQATETLDLLESEPFVNPLHAERLQAALILVRSVGDLAAAPIADEHGNLDAGTTQLIFKYRNA